LVSLSASNLKVMEFEDEVPLNILYNGNFLDFRKRSFKPGAILLNNGIIEQFFTKLPRIAAKKLNLDGAYVIPGFTDSHTHLLARGIALQRIELNDCPSLNECLERLYEARHCPVIFGSNWDESKWQPNEIDRLNKSLLDKISRDKPVIMRRVCGHFAVVNTRALKLIPRHWRIVQPKTGRLYEDVVLNLNEIFIPDEEMLKTGLKLATNEALSKGITSIHEITNAPGFRIYQKMHHYLKLRVAVYLPLKYLNRVISLGLSSGLGDDLLKFAGIKIFMDGSIGAQTAAVSRPYRGTKKRGQLLLSLHSLKEAVRLAEGAGIQLMVHAIGDRATGEVLKVFKENIGKKNPLRHRLEHIEILNDNLIHEIARLNLIASMQPNFVKRWQNPGGMYESLLGERYQGMNPFKRLLKADIKLIFGSDCMPLGPLWGIEGAVGHPANIDRLGIFEALRLYTEKPAYATFDEEKKGTLQPGRFADLVILDKNPLKEEPISRVKILMVFLGGKVVYKKAGQIA